MKTAKVELLRGSMKYRVIEDFDSAPEERFQVQHSIYGGTWATDAKYADQVSAEIHMEKLAAGPRVVASVDDPD